MTRGELLKLLAAGAAAAAAPSAALAGPERGTGLEARVAMCWKRVRRFTL